MQGRPRLSVYVITYNQEDVIHRTMESLLKQKEYIYEICINDDCSKDKTFEILKDYQRQFPDIVKPVQNEHNLGIFANMEAVMTRLTGDMVYQLSGDDVCPDGYFKAVFDFIEKKQIDWRNELFCIYGDYLQIGSNGNKTIYHHNLVNDNNAIKLKIRKLLSGRSACYSKKVLEKFEKISDGRSFRVELAQDCQVQLFSKHNYYIPVVGNIYYAEIGVSAHMTPEQQKDNTFGGYAYFIDFLKKHNFIIDKRDLAFIEYMKAYRSGDIKGALKYYIKSIDLSLGLKGLNTERIVSVIRKKQRRR